MLVFLLCSHVKMKACTCVFVASIAEKLANALHWLIICKCDQFGQFFWSFQLCNTMPQSFQVWPSQQIHPEVRPCNAQTLPLSVGMLTVKVHDRTLRKRLDLCSLFRRNWQQKVSEWEHRRTAEVGKTSSEQTTRILEETDWTRVEMVYAIHFKCAQSF